MNRAKRKRESAGQKSSPPVSSAQLRRAAEELKQANEALVLAGIREQELAERATALYEQAQRATRARDDFLAIVSHDLRSPLSTILLSIGVLLRSNAEYQSLPRKQIECIKRSAELMSRLIQDLLDAASIEAGRLSISPTPLDLASVVSQAFEALAPMLIGKSLQLRMEVPQALPQIYADPARLQQVLANLLGNAIKFTPDGGTITLCAEPLGDTLQISIRDTGSGIAGKDLPHLFERFWQARPAAGVGTGLGLYIVRGIIEAHGGRIWAESQVRAGSTFFFTLPIARAGTNATSMSGPEPSEDPARYRGM